jgi:hypothetical protein
MRGGLGDFFNIFIYLLLSYIRRVYSIEHLHLPLQNNMLFVKCRVGPLVYMALPHKQILLSEIGRLVGA